MDDAERALAEQIRSAAADRTPLCIRAGGSKDFYGGEPRGERLDPRGVRGIVDYDPSELVVTARAGTPLAELEATLAERGQMLAFEPPHHGRDATVSGCIAAGLAGPRRAASGPATGSVRDSLLGAVLLDGRGRRLAFGGTVIKNVAGYDVSRVLAGSLGILGVILQVSLKVVPRPACEATLRYAFDEQAALDWLCARGAEPLPISASAWASGRLSIRLSGAPEAVAAARARLGGELLEPELADGLWRDLREHVDPFHAGDAPTWRLSLPPGAPPLGYPEPQLIEWGGAQRWLRSALPAATIRARAAALGGSAQLYRRIAGGAVHPFDSPAAPSLAIQRRLKAAFDPAGVFNPGRLHPDL